MMRAEIQSETTFVGPLPSPQALEQYQAILPDLPAALLEGLNKEREHRHKVEIRVVEIQAARAQAVTDIEKRGQALGVLLAFSALVASVVLALTGHDAVAGIIGGTTTVGLATAFVVGRRAKKAAPEPPAPDGD